MNDQARDRLVRIGQERTVFVHTFTCRGTVEERLDGIIRRKRGLVQNIIEKLAVGRPDMAGDTERALSCWS